MFCVLNGCGLLKGYILKFEVDDNHAHMETPEDRFVYCVQHAIEMKSDRYTYLHKAVLNEHKLRRIYDGLIEKL